jgi:hypothetical protein
MILLHIFIPTRLTFCSHGSPVFALVAFLRTSDMAQKNLTEQVAGRSGTAGRNHAACFLFFRSLDLERRQGDRSWGRRQYPPPCRALRLGSGTRADGGIGGWVPGSLAGMEAKAEIISLAQSRGFAGRDRCRVGSR